MVLPNFQCRNPACDEESNSKNESNSTKAAASKSKCEFMEKCASSCAAYGRVCPCAARAAGAAACRAVDKLYTTDSQIFQDKPDFTKLNCDDLVISNKLGEGGFSVVHRVTLMKGAEKGQTFAVKYLKRKIMVDQHAFELGAADLAVEANFLAQLAHPHIVQLHGITSGSVETNVATGKECGFFIIIDMLKESLEQKIKVCREQQKNEKGNLLSRLSSEFKEKRKMALAQRCKIAVQIADAMIYLHSRKIVYRDLKPDNIGFVDNVTATVKLFDFGLAKELKEKHLDGTYKLTGNTGSRRYMAPEVAKEQHYGLPVDVFSFGILLHELASLEKPFQGYTANKHMTQVVMGGERPKIDAHHFPMELQWLLKKCWSAKPEDRPSFVAVKKCLEDLVLVMTQPHSGVATSGTKSPKFARVARYRSTGQNTAVKGAPASPMKKKSMEEHDVPDFSRMKPLSKPARQTKSLGFLRKSPVT
mmetsp:Transcript_18689/g.30977  ORF Transcript_18689/g.30977 Transcript_18689/m.30977 type:complete len:475 (-) Transcript_18689:67-1491(-)|eukprot:CAMPEP_0119005400 /NCGR_PEP_ID=MMETSP1176-20130426/1696_1 /TAXON_ID=265551 /ORGANISM="Synedropsis recta cf, Strain CCMP1620" /LENGTH=474 /DNA_ID=CAMNT_0006957201 /DNA_START=107 /DNA_END=1531 /DNA_ORIENTATION=+